VAHADAPGFSQDQQRHLGALVLGQRGGLRKVEPTLAHPDRRWQLLCLRLAAITCHARADAPAGWRLKRGPNAAELRFDTAGAVDLRTLHLLREEVLAWQRGSALGLSVCEPETAAA
jgi:exopolyphosphatase/guanosine-5'-triphosphate,3'-diphosphate pyrophosphatase